jgi:hypothetical protein
MLDSKGLNISMIEGDYGITLPIKLVSPQEMTSSDKFSLKIFKKKNTEPLISKEYENIADNTINFSLTEEESKLLSRGRYYYDLDWYQNNSFLGNLVAESYFDVKDKAGAINED